MKSLHLLTTFMVLFITAPLMAQLTEADHLVGVWETENGRSHVKISKSGNTYYGRIIWLKEPLNDQKKPKMDKNNPDPDKQTLPLIGTKILSGFEFKGADVWEDGTIYDPENGKTYKCKISKNGNTQLNIRGFIGISMIGRTTVWKRVN